LYHFLGQNHLIAIILGLYSVLWAITTYRIHEGLKIFEVFPNKQFLSEIGSEIIL
jgi:hypothetical protein